MEILANTLTGARKSYSLDYQPNAYMSTGLSARWMDGVGLGGEGLQRELLA